MNVETGVQRNLPRPDQLPVSSGGDRVLRIAHDPMELAAFRKLAYEEYAQRQWLNPNDHDGRMLVDEFDKHSDALTITSGAEVIAGTRVVRHSSLGFPHARELKLECLRPEFLPDPNTYSTITTTPKVKCAEVTRVVGKRVVRKLTLDIIKCLYWYAKSRDIELYYMVIDLGFFTLCTEHNGIPITPIGIPVYCEGSWTIPALTEPHQWPELISTENPAGWSYINDQGNLDHTWSLQ